MIPNRRIRQTISLGMVFAFLGNFLVLPVHAQDFKLPAPGVMIHLSPEFSPAILKGIKVRPDDPFRFDFILDKGDSPLGDDKLQDESMKLIKYFLVSLTVPEKDLWVNLSPYEKERIIPQSFGLTEMGRDLLAEDYMLKQLTASLIYPEGEVGKKFWARVYQKAAERFGTTAIPVNTFNKVWIVPDKAVVYENAKAGTAYVVDSKLKVMLEEDYLSLQNHLRQPGDTHTIGSQIIREIVVPQLTREINEGRNFVRLRQVYNSLILAAWYKKKIRESILSRVYEDKNKVAGVMVDDPKEKERIYQRYLAAFKKGVYDYIKEKQDPLTQELVPRKYFSGGMDLALNATHFDFKGLQVTDRWDGISQESASGKEMLQVRVDAAMAVSISPETYSTLKKIIAAGLLLGVTASNLSINDTTEDQLGLRFIIPKDQLSDVPADSVYFGVIRDLTDKIKSGDPQATIKLLQLSAQNNNLGRLSSDYVKFLSFTDIARVLASSFDHDFFDSVYYRNPELFEKTSLDEMKKTFMSLNVPNAESAFVETVGYLYARHHYGSTKDKNSVKVLLAYANKGNLTAVKYLLATMSRYDVGRMLKSKEPIDVFFKEFDFTGYIKGLDLKEDHYFFRDMIKAGNRSVIEFIVKKAKASDIEAWSILLDDTMTGFYPAKDINGIMDTFSFNSYQGIELLGKLLAHGNAKAVAMLYGMVEKGDLRALKQLFELSFENPDVEKKLEKDRDRLYVLLKDKKSLLDLLYFFKNNYLEFYKAPVDENDLDSVLFYLKHTDFQTEPEAKKIAEAKRKYLLENKVDPVALEAKYRKDEIDRFHFEDILNSLLSAHNHDAFKVLLRQVKNSDLLTIRPVIGIAEGEGPFVAEARAFLKTFHFDPSFSAPPGWEFEELVLLATAVKYGNAQARPIFSDRLLKQKPSELAITFRSSKEINDLVREGFVELLNRNDPVFMAQFRAKFWGEPAIQSFVFERLMPRGVEFAFRGYFDMARKGSDGLDRTLKVVFINSRKWTKANIEKISRLDFGSLLRPGDAKNIYIDLLLRRLSELGVASAQEALDKYGFSHDYSPGQLTQDNLNARYQAAENFITGLQKDGFKKFIQTIGPYDLPTMKRFMTKFYSSILIVENTRARMLDLEKMNRLLSLVPYLVEIETDYDNADNSLDIGFYLIKNMKSFEELLFVLGHEQGHNILEMLLGYDILADNKIDGGLNEAFGDWMGLRFVGTLGEASRILHSYASPLKAQLKKKEFNEMEAHDQARSLEMIALETAAKYGLNGQDILKQLAPLSKSALTRNSRLEKVFYVTLTRYFSSKYGKRQMPAPVGDDIRSNIDSIFKYYTQKNAQKNPGDKAMKANYGGIDLASAARRLQTQGNGTINFHIDPALLRQLQDAPGFVPVIINIKPMNDLKEFLGAPPKVPPKVPGH